MKGVIYSYAGPNGKMYIGQTLMLQRKRIDKHKYEALTKCCSTPFGNAIRKYGWGIIRKTYNVIEEINGISRNDLKSKLTEKENYYIEKYNTFVPNGYNVKLTNQKEVGEYRNKKDMYIKISNSLKGKYMNAESTSKKIIDISNQTIYPSISEAGRTLGVSVQEICGMLKGKRLNAGGHKFCYINQDGSIDSSNLRETSRKQLPVYCPELDKHFVSAYEAAKYIGKPEGKANVRVACETGRKRYGYMWKYDKK